MDFINIKNVFGVRGLEVLKYEASYEEIKNRMQESISANTPDNLGELRSIREFSLVLRQILLHRAIKLFEGAFNALLDGNVYLMALSIRGHFETTAALGYLHSRLNSLSQGTLEASTVHKDIIAQILGSREKGLLKRMQQFGVEAKQVLKLFEYADKSVNKHLLSVKSKEEGMLTDSYKFLCEYCHPNFHSNIVAFELRQDEGKFYFLYNNDISDRDLGIMGYLLISNGLFIELFDGVEEFLSKE